MKCIFCEIIEEKKVAHIVWENTNFIAILDVNPINKGHLLLLPKKHIDDVFDMPEPLFVDIFLSAKKLAPVLKKHLHVKRIGVAIEGFHVPHVHIHLVPVNNGNELNPNRAQEASQELLAQLAMDLSKEFDRI